MTRTRSRRALVVVAAVIAVQLAVLALIWHDSRQSEVHDVAIAIAAPPIVADGLVDDIGRLDGRPFEARIATTPQQVRRQVRDGIVVAGLAVDLVATGDTLYVASAHGRTLTDAVIDKTRALEKGYDREVKVVDVVPVPAGDNDLRTTRILVIIWMATGFVASAGIAFVKGTRPLTRSASLKRLLGLGALAIAAGIIGALATSGMYGGSTLAVVAVGALTTFTAGSTTMALQSLFGVAGIGMATIVFVMLAGPDAIATHSSLLPQPWPTIDPWAPHGASTSALVSIAYFGAVTALKPVLILSTWAVLSVAVTILSRRQIALDEQRG